MLNHVTWKAECESMHKLECSTISEFYVKVQIGSAAEGSSWKKKQRTERLERHQWRQVEWIITSMLQSMIFVIRAAAESRMFELRFWENFKNWVMVVS